MTKIRVKNIAEAQGLNSHSLSQKAQVGYPSVRRIWNGDASNANMRTMEKIAAVLGVPVADLFERSTSPSVNL